jgi:drug/metabolite transporter (DMT)-like permease
MDLHVTALALGAAACLGLSLVLTQIGLRYLSPMRGASISVPTTTLSFLALAPVLFDWSGFHPHSALIFALAGCLFPAVVTLLTFEANRHVGPAITGAFGNLSPLCAIVVAFVVLGEVPSAGQLAGLAVILTGVLLIIGAPRAMPGSTFGWAVVLLVLGAVIRGVVQPVVKLGLEAWPSPYSATLIGYVISAAVILTVAGFKEDAPASALRLRGWPWFIPVGLLNGAAVLSMYAALVRGPVAVVAPLVACYPLATLGFSKLLLGSGGLTRSAVLGVVVTVIGVALLLRG